MAKIFYSLLILAFFVTGFVDSAPAHAAVKNSSSHSARQIKNTCKNIPLAQNNHDKQEAKQTPKQEPAECETLHCNFHFMFVGQNNPFVLISINENHIDFIEKQPFILQLKTSKRPPRILS